MKFIRKNALVISGTFTVSSDPTLQPGSATAILNYKNTLGRQVSTTIALSNNNNVWSGVWDSSDCKEGRVDWMVYSSGGVVAADQGFFEVYANEANKV